MFRQFFNRWTLSCLNFNTGLQCLMCEDFVIPRSFLWKNNSISRLNSDSMFSQCMSSLIRQTVSWDGTVHILWALTAQIVCCEGYSHIGRTGLSVHRWRSVCHQDSKPHWSDYPHETDSSLYATPPSTEHMEEREKNQTSHTLIMGD